MCSQNNLCKSGANSILILGHTTSGMGEKTLAVKLKTALEELKISVEPIVDIIELMKDAYQPLAQLNYDLALSNLSLIEEIRLPELKEIRKRILSSSADVFLITSWSFSLAALFALGIHLRRHVAAKLYVHHPNGKVHLPLYEPARLLITESLLANERGASAGIEAGKMLYVPHHYPRIAEMIQPCREYVKRLACSQGKKITSQTLIIGTASRLEYGKNCEFALEACRRLVDEGHKICFVLKGDFSQENFYPKWRSHFSKMLAAYQKEPWFLWDTTPSSFPDVLYEYAAFDIALHLSGAEGGSHVIVEYLGLQKPICLLDSSTNPYLFGEAAIFVQPAAIVTNAQLPFYIPEMNDLMEKLKELVIDPKWREEVAARGARLAKRRFHIECTKAKLSLFMQAVRAPKAYRGKIEALYEQDRKVYGI